MALAAKAIDSEDLSEEYSDLALDYLQKRQITLAKRDEIEKSTQGQSSSPEWFKIRRQILSSTKFHRVVTKKKETSCAALVKEIIYGSSPSNQESPGQSQSHFHPKAMQWGIDHEDAAKRTYIETYNNEVQDCGIFLDVPYGILGASPDGLIDSDGLLEIKCPYTAAKNNAEDVRAAVESGDIKYLQILPDGTMELKKNHQYYFQITGQLALSDRKWCDFYVWLSDEIPGANFCQRIHLNETLWELLAPELRRFYETCILPELVEPHYTIGKPIRNIDFTINGNLKKFVKSLSEQELF